MELIKDILEEIEHYFFKKWYAYKLKKQGDPVGLFEPPKRSRKDWHIHDGNIGAVKKIIFPDSHGWLDEMPELEVQNEFCESMDCFSWNQIRPIQAIQKKLYNFIKKYSFRFSNVMANGTPNGGSPSVAVNSIRVDGLLPQEDLPWTSVQNTWWKFSSPRPMLQNLKDKAKQWGFTVNYDLPVYPQSPLAKLKNKLKGISQADANCEAMVHALQSSPLAVTLYAYAIDSNGFVYRPKGYVDNHLTVVADFVYGKYWIVPDSYPGEYKKVPWYYDFTWVYRYNVDKNTTPEDDAKWITDKMFGKNVKGDREPGIYFIYDGKKNVYPSMDEYNKICDFDINLNRTPIIVSQDALNLLPEGQTMLLENIKNIKPFDEIK